MKLIILAGGTGTRLWPVSRQNNPKQVQPFVDDDTLLQKTYQRLRAGFSARDIFIVTGNKYLPSIKEQLPELDNSNYIIEPMRRNTAAAIGLAATYFYYRNPKEIIAVISSDHFVRDEKEYLRVIKTTEEIIKQKPDHGILIGLKPLYPETGYGYIKMNDYKFSVGRDNVFHVDQFIEKPDLVQAQEYIERWEYLWNPGYFVWRVDTLLEQYKKYLPDTYRQLAEINRRFNTPQERAAIEKAFIKIKPISIDYGIMEKADNLLVMPADFGFADIGNWRTIKDVLQNGQKKTISKGLVIEVDSSDNLIYNFSGKALAAAGVKNTIIIATDDSILICHQDSAQDVKKITEKLKEMELERYL